VKYIATAILLIASVYPFSYAGYVWRKKNYLGALGMAFLSLLSVVYPAYLLFIR
jgi:nitrate reductase gamma subunit